MPKDDELLRNITTFPKLVGYLRDELEWPIEEASFDDLMFDYEPEELGLDPKTAVKIRSIKQLRPLTAGQPWGVFFVEFERKRLPVVVMRRILSALALKKRASAGKSDQAAWRASDLLFISSFGEEGGRGITFAHFAPDEQGHDLPALKVLGWDGDDTKLHTRAVAESLASGLVWPSDPKDVDAWRTQWSSVFVLTNREGPETSRELSIQLARLAAGIRKRAQVLLASESDRGPLRKLHKEFKEVLLHDLSADCFADMYAQTIAYGLLAAKLENPDSPTPLAASALADMIPPTSPFLRGLLSEFLRVGGRKGYLDFDELGIGDVVDILRKAKMKAILLDFNDLKPEEDPVIHFYELFLSEYDHAQKMRRGVFFTPRPVVSFIVRSVDDILRVKFGIRDGLADAITWGNMIALHPGLKIPTHVAPDEPFVRILDPATGTATFLVEVIDVIYETMTTKWLSQGKSKAEVATLWNDYVPSHLLPRLYGFEVQMAPYIIAHIKLGLKLRETGYCFASAERARVFLTNTLEEPVDHPGILAFGIPPIAREAQDAVSVKRTLAPTVVLGNPPYSGMSANMEPAARKIVAPYRFIGDVRIKEKSALSLERNLNEDYVKFIRWSESIIDNSVGILAMITNNGYLDTATLRGMRHHLLTTFSSIHILDLHGDADRREKASDGTPDENVFVNVKHGVAVSIMVRVSSEQSAPQEICIGDLRGRRAVKFEALKRDIDSHLTGRLAKPREPNYLFRAVEYNVEAEYLEFEPLEDVFAGGCTGITSGDDEVLTGFGPAELSRRLRDFATSTEQSVHERYSIAGVWASKVFSRRSTIAGDEALEKRLKPFLFAPFDVRWCYYKRDFLMTSSYGWAKHLMNGPNVALVTMRQVALDGPYSHVLCTNVMPNNRCMYSTKGKASFFPLFLYSEEGDLMANQGTLLGSNLQPGLIEKLSGRLNCSYVAKKTLQTSVQWTPDEFFAYLLAVTASNAYRTRYDGLLRMGQPRIPLPGAVGIFFELAALGARLISFELLRIEAKDVTLGSPLGDGSLTVGEVSYDTEQQRVFVNRANWFDGITPAVWQYRIGGYQVLLKWLKDRGPKGGEPGRVLSSDEILHYRKMVTAVAKTIELQAEIDHVIAAAGGFPDAFR